MNMIIKCCSNIIITIIIIITIDKYDYKFTYSSVMYVINIVHFW